jgi:hypothetical protein
MVVYPVEPFEKEVGFVELLMRFIGVAMLHVALFVFMASTCITAFEQFA